MYELTVDSHFDAAHCIEGYKGKCARIHGHTWRVSVTVKAKELGELGLSIDFKDIVTALESVVQRFDHQVLNEISEFTHLNPTAENIARLLFELLSEKLNGENVRVLSVTVGEGEMNRVTYKQDG